MNRAIVECPSQLKVQIMKLGHTHGSFLRLQGARLRVNQVAVAHPLRYAPGHLDGADVFSLNFKSVGARHSMVETGRIR